MEHATQYRSSIAYRAWVRPKPGPSDSTAKAIAATAANPAPVANHEGHRQHWAGNDSDRIERQAQTECCAPNFRWRNVGDESVARGVPNSLADSVEETGCEDRDNRPRQWKDRLR